MRVLVPQGIGDSVWSLLKVESLMRQLGGRRPLTVLLNCHDPNDPVECRGLEFVKRFAFVDSAGMCQIGINAPGPRTDEDGRYRYVRSGPIPERGIDYFLGSNEPMERGVRLEDWLPEYPVRWDALDDFRFTHGEIREAERLKARWGGYAVFFMGSESGNTAAGHNRGGLWRPEQWAELGERILDLKQVDFNGGREEIGRIVVVGAEYDRSYWERHVQPLISAGSGWENGWESAIGRWGIGQTFAVCRGARFVVSYQSGIGIASHYLGVPTAIFWRQEGDSISPYDHVSFDERMASAWARPDYAAAGKHLPLFYGRHDVEYIMGEIKRRGW